MAAFSPGLLLPVSGVEVRVLRRGGPTVSATSDAAERIAELWRQLPPGRQARCHTPPYELRFLVGCELVCSGTVCWTCNNIHGSVGGEPFIYEFDASAPPSQALLAEVRKVVGDSANAEPEPAT